MMIYILAIFAIPIALCVLTFLLWAICSIIDGLKDLWRRARDSQRWSGATVLYDGRRKDEPSKKDGPPSITGALLWGAFIALLWCGASVLFGQPWAAAFSPFAFTTLFFAFCSHEDDKSAWEKRQYDEIKAKLEKKNAPPLGPTRLSDYSTEELKDEIDPRNQKPDPNIRAAF
jgi:hypothetical protein